MNRILCFALCLSAVSLKAQAFDYDKCIKDSLKKYNECLIQAALSLPARNACYAYKIVRDLECNKKDQASTGGDAGPVAEPGRPIEIAPVGERG